uniref:non-specific serine/threonine protein kinase n=1 Tax=Coturnix japonica TaxID=93934 RepID=A0A8C2SNQ5_COTJA
EVSGHYWFAAEASRGLMVEGEASPEHLGKMLLESSRSTFCAIISQLTEETQPLFETTIKSRSVSEDSDAKFTCIVTGYPQPEVTWYKDNEEMDRYCGLPKYQIFHHGNRHTLQLYKCQEEDAGIYQASARNTKGIVSCSGVLEVGTMTEFKIHQRWFAKIKRKAEEKLREIEQSKKRGKENVEVECVRGISPDRLQRKRRLARDLNLRSGASLWEKEDAAKVHVTDSKSRLREDVADSKEKSINAMTGLPSKLITPLKAEVTTNGDTSLETVEENGNGFLAYIYETVEDLVSKPLAKDSAAKKKKKVEDVPAAKQEVSKREESGRDRVKPSTNPRFVEATAGPSASDTKHPVSGPVIDSSQQADKLEKLRKETSVSQETRGTGKRTNPRLRFQETPKPPAPSADHAQTSREQPDSRAQAEGHSHSLEDRETQLGLSNQEVESQGTKEPLPKKLSPSEPGEDTPHEKSTHQTAVKYEKSKEEGVEPSGSKPCAEAGGSRVAELSPEMTGTPLGLQETETPATASFCVAGEKPIPTAAEGTLVVQEAQPATRSNQGMETIAGEAPSGIQLLPPASKDTETKKADGAAMQMFPTSTSGEADAKPVSVVPQREEGGMQPATAPSQQPAATLGIFERGAEVQPQAPLISPSPERPQEMTLEEKTPHKNLVSSLKNYLLLLLQLSDSSKDAMKEDAETKGEEPSTAEEAPLPAIGIAGLSPHTSRRVLEKVQNNQLFQTAENLPLTPRTSRRITGMINEEFITSKEMLACRPVPPKRRTKMAPEAEGPLQLSVPSIVVGSVPSAAVGQPPHSVPSLPPVISEKESPADPQAVLPCATPEELASGARRKIYLPKTKQVGEEEEISPESQGHARSPTGSPLQSKKSAALLQTPALASFPPTEKHSPTLIKKMATLEVPKLYEEPTGNSSRDHDVPEDAKPVEQPAESKKASNPFKAPQVIRKIRAEQFSDASGNLKLWCQFFNVLSDSKLMWYKDEIPVAEAQRSAGDEGQAALAIVQASQKDCGVYRCVISNEYGTDSTDFLLSPEVLSGFILREEIEVGEEIEMTPMVFAKGLADAGYWGDKFFGRVMSEDMELGAGFLRKACRARAIYGLEPVFESGCTCIIKVHNFIVFGTKNENSLIEKNYDITIQECKIQNSSREYCKIFAAEARAVPGFGAVPEIVPLYLIYRPANNIPYATVEEDLGGPCEQYCVTERDGSLVARGTSEIVLKCCTFQHWVYQWTNGNILVTDMEGVGWKMTNVRMATNLKGYQGLKESWFPSLLEQFSATHQCNHYCDILGLKTLEPVKPKGSKSPSMGRKSAQSSPQLQKKGTASPQGTRKTTVSPRSARRMAEAAEAQAASKTRPGEASRPTCSQ